MTTSPETIKKLETLLNDSVKDLKSTIAKKMFGCHAAWVNDNVFALVWKHGRIGYKLPDAAIYDELMAKTGAEPWKAGPKQMAHWVLVPESFHTKPAELKKWATKAHGLCSDLTPKVKPKAKAPATKKVVKKTVKKAIKTKKG